METDLKNIVEQYGQMISMISHRMIRNKELAKDAAQEVWYEVLKSIHSFNENSELSTWIYTIAKRTILRYSQSERFFTLAELKDFRSLAEIEYTGEEESKREWIKEQCDCCLTAMNHCLNNDARLIFILKETIGLSYKQLSEIMEMKEENIRQISSRSFSKISNFMNDTCPLYNPAGTCKCRIRKHVLAVDLDKEYASVREMMRLIDLYQKFEKELPRKNYWEKFLNQIVTN
jgi:RNA polymerase sigma-70 factor (ECF subfamily)